MKRQRNAAQMKEQTRNTEVYVKEEEKYSRSYIKKFHL